MAGGYVGDAFQRWIEDQRIVHEITTSYSLESNRSAKRLNRTLRDTARTILQHTKESQTEFVGCGNQYCVVSNHLMTKVCREHKTLSEIVHQKRPKVEHKNVFHSRVFVYKPKEKREGTSDTSAETEILVGFSCEITYRVLLNNNEIII